MKSIVIKELSLNFSPVVFLKSDKMTNIFPARKSCEDSKCLLPFFVSVAKSNKTLVFDKNAPICKSGIEALGLNEISRKKIISKSNKLVWVSNARNANNKYNQVVLKTVSELDESERPHEVMFALNSKELSLIVALCDHLVPSMSIIYFNGRPLCQMMSLCRLKENDLKCAVLGILDFPTKLCAKDSLPDDYAVFILPWNVFLKLEEAAQKGFFDSKAWNTLKNKN